LTVITSLVLLAQVRPMYFLVQLTYYSYQNTTHFKKKRY
jgi:hypothetical protein